MCCWWVWPYDVRRCMLWSAEQSSHLRLHTTLATKSLTLPCPSDHIQHWFCLQLELLSMPCAGWAGTASPALRSSCKLAIVESGHVNKNHHSCHSYSCDGAMKAAVSCILHLASLHNRLEYH